MVRSTSSGQSSRGCVTAPSTSSVLCANTASIPEVAAGGATNSDLWMQTHADVSGVPISFTRVSDTPALGSAILAAVGSGIYPDIQTGAHNMVHVERQIEPEQGRHEEYQFFVDKYVETYPKVRDLIHETVGHVSG